MTASCDRRHPLALVTACLRDVLLGAYIIYSLAGLYVVKLTISLYYMFYE